MEEAEIEKIEPEHDRIPLMERLARLPGFEKIEMVQSADGISVLVLHKESGKKFLLTVQLIEG